MAKMRMLVNRSYREKTGSKAGIPEDDLWPVTWKFGVVIMILLIA